MTKVRVYPYKRGSNSANALAERLGGRTLRLYNSRYVQRRDDLVINWGSSQYESDTCLNLSSNVAIAANKLSAFDTMWPFGVPIPEYWTEEGEIPDEAFPIVCRTVLTGHSGVGIHIANTRNDLVRAPLYVKYVRKTHEFRIHVGMFDGEVVVISQQRKAIRDGAENINHQVRNLANGYVFVREGVEVPLCVTQAASEALAALGLDFGAVDVTYSTTTRLATVLEVNTACGLEGQTIDDYAAFFERFM